MQQIVRLRSALRLCYRALLHRALLQRKLRSERRSPRAVRLLRSGGRRREPTAPLVPPAAPVPPAGPDAPFPPPPIPPISDLASEASVIPSSGAPSSGAVPAAGPSPFRAAVLAALSEALPPGWAMLAAERLPQEGLLRLSAAAPLQGCPASGPHLAVLALDACELGALLPHGVPQLAALRRRVVRRGSILVLVLDDPAGRRAELDDLLGLTHPQFLALPCALDRRQGWLAVGFRQAPLASILRELWHGELSYQGPRLGLETAGVETMRRACWQCLNPLEVVTGIVFPDRPVADWSTLDWTYYGRILEPSSIEEPALTVVSQAVDEWRSQGAVGLTPLRSRYSRTARQTCLGAVCPLCGSLQGSFLLLEERTRHLHDLKARVSGDLAYRPLQVEVTEALLANLSFGHELTPHCRYLGWQRGDEHDARPMSLIGRVSML